LKISGGEIDARRWVRSAVWAKRRIPFSLGDAKSKGQGLFAYAAAALRGAVGTRGCQRPPCSGVQGLEPPFATAALMGMATRGA